MEKEVRILLVDDDEDDYVITRDLLEEISHQPFRIDWVATYPAAMAAFARQEYDVYLVDYLLTNGTGLDLLREAKSIGCEAPIIFITGQGDSRIDLEAMKAGAADYLVKGKFDAWLLERAIRYALQRQRMNQAIANAEKLKTVQQLAGAICHEFSQPLQVLSLSLMLLKENPSDINQHIDTCKNMINRINGLVRKLGNITEIKSQPYLNMQIVDLNASASGEPSLKTNYPSANG